LLLHSLEEWLPLVWPQELVDREEL
jgi:hypothetical protein